MVSSRPRSRSCLTWIAAAAAVLSMLTPFVVTDRSSAGNPALAAQRLSLASVLHGGSPAKLQVAGPATEITSRKGVIQGTEIALRPSRALPLGRHPSAAASGWRDRPVRSHPSGSSVCRGPPVTFSA